MKKNLALGLVAIFLVVACAAGQVTSFKAASYRALTIMGTSYDTAMTGVAALHRNGLVDDTVKAEAIRLGDIYHDSYHAAVDALKVFAESADEAQYNNAQEKIAAVGQALGKLLGYVNPILVKHGMKEVK